MKRSIPTVTSALRKSAETPDYGVSSQKAANDTDFDKNQ